MQQFTVTKLPVYKNKKVICICDVIYHAKQLIYCKKDTIYCKVDTVYFSSSTIPSCEGIEKTNPVNQNFVQLSKKLNKLEKTLKKLSKKVKKPCYKDSNSASR